LPAVGALVPGGLPSAAVLLDESLGRQGAQGLARVRRLESEVGLQFGDYLAADREGVVARVLDDLPRNRRRELGRSSPVLLRRRERTPVLGGVYLSEVPS
jgi:hypothetical protein